MLHLILRSDSIVDVESLEDASNIVKSYINEHGLRPELYLTGQVFDDDENLIAMIAPDGDIMTESNKEFWEFSELVLKMIIKESQWAN